MKPEVGSYRVNDANQEVQDKHDTAEDMHAAADAHRAVKHRVMNHEAREDQQDHRDEVHIVSHHEGYRMGLFVVGHML